MHGIALKKSKDQQGQVLPDLWESDIVRMEAVDGGWECSVPMRAIGRSAYYEFRPLSMGGKFIIVGTYRTKNDCCVIAERLQAGTHVLRREYQDSLGIAPRAVVPWTDVSDEIATTA